MGFATLAGEIYPSKGFTMRGDVVGKGNALVPYNRATAIRNQGLGYLQNGLQYAKGVGSKVAQYVGESALPSVTRMAASKTGLGMLAAGSGWAGNEVTKERIGDNISTGMMPDGYNTTIKAPSKNATVVPVVSQPVPVVSQPVPVVQKPDSSKSSGKTGKSKVATLLAPPALVAATTPNVNETPFSAVGQVVGDVPYQMSNLPIGSGVNQDLYGAEFNNANRYAGYNEASNVNTNIDSIPKDVNADARDTFWGNLTRAGGYSEKDWNAMTPEQRIQAGAQKSNLASGMEQFGQLTSGASALAGIYGTMQNAKYLKDQTNMQKAMIRSDDANKSAFAKAAGGTYTRTGV